MAQLALAVHEIGDDREPEGVRHSVKRIRKKMTARGEPHGIVTVYGVGYYYDPAPQRPSHTQRAKPE